VAVKQRSARSTTPSTRLVTPVFLIIMASTFAYFLSVGATIPVLPLFVEGPLGGTEAAVGLSVGAFSLSAVLIRPLTGRWGDRYGRRFLILVGGTVVGIAVATYVAADSLPVLIAMRLLTGAGEAFFYVGAASAINDIAPDHRRGEAMSFFSLALYGGIALGPVLGESVLEASSFDAVWIVAALLSWIAAFFGVFVTDTRPEGHEVARPFGRWVHPAGLLPGAVLATSVWGLAGFNSFVPLYAREVGLSGSRLVFVVFSVIVLSIRSFGARIPDRLGPVRTARSSLVASACGLALMGLIETQAGVFIGASIFALGQALAFPALMTIAVSGAPPAQRGSVVATFTAFFDLAFGLGAVTLGVIANAVGYSGTFVAAGIVAAIGFVLMLRLASRGLVGRRPGRVEESCEPL
jgi:MFS family permease